MIEEVRLDDLIILQRGFDITEKEQKSGCVPVISSGGISSYHDEFKVKGPGVVIGRKGTLGKVYFTSENYWPHDTSLWVKDFKGNDPKFIYYLLQVLHFEKFDAGAANPTLNRNHIHSLKLKVPKKQYRSKIASVLSAYDELIENNKQRIMLLEEMAGEIYKEWFVRLRFPGYETSNFFNNEDEKVAHGTKGALPGNWQQVKISDIFNTSSGGTPSRSNEAFYIEGNINWVKTKELLGSFVFSTEEKITENALKNSSAKIFPPDTILMGMYGGVHGEGRKSTLGQLGILTESASTNQACCAFLPKMKEDYSFPYLFHYLKSKQTDFLNLSMGAAQQNISQDIIKNSAYLKPEVNILKKFELIEIPLFEEIKVLMQKNQLLQQTRDLLLPRLISGKLSVEHLVEEEEAGLSITAEPEVNYHAIK